MIFRDRIVFSLVKSGIKLIRIILPRVPDRAIAVILRIIERTAYAVSSDPILKESIAEVAEVFASGPPYTTMVRKIVAGMEPDYVASIIKSQKKSSPYGAM